MPAVYSEAASSPIVRANLGYGGRRCDAGGVAGSSHVRIGDAERDDAVTLLGDHLAAGRVDYAEFEQRVGVVLLACTRGELDAVFDDLPGRRPGWGDAGPVGQGGRGGSVAACAGQSGASQLAGGGGRWLPTAVAVGVVTICSVTVWWLARGVGFMPLMFVSWWWVGPLARLSRRNNRRR